MTTHLLRRCRRCEALVVEPHADPEAALRRALEAGILLTVHVCRDGASGVADLVGTGPGRHPAETLASSAEEARQ